MAHSACTKGPVISTPVLSHLPRASNSDKYPYQNHLRFAPPDRYPGGPPPSGTNGQGRYLQAQERILVFLHLILDTPCEIFHQPAYHVAEAAYTDNNHRKVWWV